MPCNPIILRKIPLFALLDDDEAAVLASHVEHATFTPRQRIYKMGDPGGRGYVVLSGMVRVTTVDEDHQEVIVDEPAVGEFFGFASMLDSSPHQTSAAAVEAVECLAVDRHDIEHLLKAKPLAGMDMLAVLGKQYHGSQKLVRIRSMRNPNEVIEESLTVGDRVADAVARFGGSWTFITTCFVALSIYTVINVWLGTRAWDPYPFILLNLFLSMLAAIQAPIIMMSQNRQDSKDRVRGELDFAVNRRAESEIRALSRKLNTLGEKMEDVEQVVRALRTVR